MDEPLLLYSLSEHRDLILRCLDAAGARTVVEIGSEAGSFTRDLVGWAGEHEARIVSVEPLPAAETRALAAGSEQLELVEAHSPEALAELAPADAYVVDGDHNWWTVTRELEAVFGGREGEGAPIAILHDVGWPCARRDQYYAPDRLPPEAVHPHSFTAGRVPGEAGVLENRGFRGRGEFAVALEEGGPANGVLTAVEDFLARRQDLELRQVASVFGLGVVFPQAASWAAAVRDVLDPFHRNPVLERLERNRLQILARLFDLQDRVAEMDHRRNRLLLEYDERLALAQADALELRLERIRLLAELERLRNGVAVA